MRRFPSLLLALLLASLAGYAVPTGLNIMPTAEILELGQDRTDYETRGSGKLFVDTDSTLLGNQVGVFSSVEGGIDDVSGEGTRYNLKLRTKDEGLLSPAVAFGVQNIASGEKPQYYMVLTKTLEPVKVSAGLLRDERSDTLTMLGISGKLLGVTLMLDRVFGGVEDRSAVGARINLGGLMLTGTAYDFEHASSEKTLSLSYLHEIF